MDGRYHTASELAFMAAIKPQTASFHLAKLVNGNLIIVENHGRHRYYRLANEEVASVLESFLTISQPSEIRSLKQSTQMKELTYARTCYDHLAGQLGVGLTNSMVASGFLEKKGMEFLITPKGEQFYTEFGLDLSKLKKKRRSFSRACLDWSERHHHLAGALGQELAAQFFDLGWIVHMPSSRAVKVTHKGKLGFEKYFHLNI
jgi:hypothetical protein